MIKVINNKDRNVLSEGRNFQMGFAFLKHLKNGSFQTVNPISPCKDYLNDVIWAEHTGNNCSAHGLVYSKQGIFEEERCGYLAIKICERFKRKGEWINFKRDRENLNSNYKNVRLFLNKIEKGLGIEDKTSIVKTTTSNLFLVRVPMQWCKYTYSISLYTFLIRIGQWYKGEEIKKYLENFNHFNEDIYLLNDIRPKLYKLLEMKSLPVQDLSLTRNNSDYDVHNCGIKTFNI